MCLAVYIASNKPLPLVSWNEEKPEFYVSELSEDENSVKIQFNGQYIYYVGSHEGCGCGFFKEGVDDNDLIKVNENYKKLSLYLKKIKEAGAIIQLYSCWEGDQTSILEHNEEINEEKLNEKQFEFKEKALYKFS